MDVPNPEFLGKIKVQMECTPLPVPEKRTLDFTFREYMGTEVLDLDKNVITDELGMWHGREVIVQGLVGPRRMKVDLTRTDICVDDPYMFGTVEFNQDDRHCWVCSCLINKKCLDQIE